MIRKKTYFVKSFTNPRKKFKVVREGSSWSCECRDNYYTGKECKHIRYQKKKLALPIKRRVSWIRKRNEKGQYMSETTAKRTKRKSSKSIKPRRKKAKSKFQKLVPAQTDRLGQETPSAIPNIKVPEIEVSSFTSLPTAYPSPPSGHDLGDAVISVSNAVGMSSAEFNEKVESAISSLYQNDSDLLELQANERAIATD